MPRVAVVTPCVGGRHLAECVASVRSQVLDGDTSVRHVLVADGPDAAGRVAAAAGPGADVVTLPWNTGRDRWNGHRIYAAVPQLLGGVADFVAYLDEDNAFEPGHVAALVRTIRERGVTWAFSLRRIVDPDGRAVCLDACESLGNLRDGVLGDRFVDVSCYMLPVPLAQACAWCWQRPARPPDGVEVDRLLYRTIQDVPHACSGEFSVRYRVGDARPDSVQAGFFLEGNRALWGR